MSSTAFVVSFAASSIFPDTPAIGDLETRSSAVAAVLPAPPATLFAANVCAGIDFKGLLI